MVRQEGERHPEHERQNNIVKVDPTTLMLDNPAGMIVNKETYEGMDAYFSPDRFEEPQVVKVRSFSSEHGEVIKLFVVDGLTRTKYAADHKGKRKLEAPDFSFDSLEVRDVTQSYLKNPRYVPPKERLENHDSLSMLQYLRAVVPPTVEHSEIAPNRMAAHFINGWDNMVGEKLSQRFSAIAALSFLKDSKIITATDKELKRSLSKEKEMVVNETPLDRARLEEQLVNMAQVIRQTKRFPSEIARAAFLLVSEESSVIGGSQVAERQVYGSLYIPQVENKLKTAYPQSSTVREQKRTEELGKSLLDASRKLQNQPERERDAVMGELLDALKDDELTYNQTIDVFTSPAPVSRYEKVRKDIHKDKLRRNYSAVFKKEQLSDTEETLIDQIGSVSNRLDENTISTMVKTVHNADNIHRQAEVFRRRLLENRDNLMRQGVSPQTIDQALSGIEETKDRMLLANTVPGLSTFINRLNDVVTNSNAKITRERSTYRTSAIVEEELKEALERSVHSFAEVGKTVSWLFDQDDIDPLNLNETRVRVRLKQLGSLNDDLRERVISGDMPINRASQLQCDRNETRTPPPTVTYRPTIRPQQPEAVTNLPAQPRPQQTEAPRQEIPVRDEMTIEDEQRAAAEIILQRNEQFTSDTRAYNRALEDIRLEKNQFTPEARRLGEETLRMLGKRLLGYNDIVQILTQQFTHLSDDNTKLREGLVELQNEIAQRDTRTGR